MAKETKAEMKAEVILENAIEGKELESGIKLENKDESAEKTAEVQPVKEERLGIAYIFSSQNNTIVHITDLAGNTLSRISGGMVTKHSRLKSDPTIAMFVAKRASERPKDLGITGLYVRMRAKTGAEGMGPGSHAVVKALDKQGFKIMGVLDSTRIPRGGPKKKGGKRGRRV
ncbi:MAG: 30S ribosomal protein S11 [Nanoarchaeota archaeon]|nr:30S ribosomal protein S11 [Nanoarchaeota archaeon]